MTPNTARLSTRYEEKWESRFSDLAAYKEEHGDCLVTRNYNGLLGSWVSTQRRFFRSKKLKADRYEKLVGIGFAFEDSRCAIENVKWNRRFMELEEFKEKNGHCNLPTTNGSFGIWISKQRTLFRSKNLKADRYEKLVGIGFVFEDARVAMDSEKWNRLFMELVEHKEKNGHCNVPTRHGSLGTWIKNQRRLFKSKKLKADRYERLVGIGFVFEDASLASENVKWIRLFMELVEYKEKNGHCNFPIMNGSLGRWISAQRILFRSKELKADRYEKLVGIGFRFEDAKFANSKTKSEHGNWNRLFVELEKYNEKNGHCNCPTTNGGSFVNWISYQRALFRSEKLKEDRYEKLVGIGFVFEDARFVSDNVKWNNIFMELEEYKDKNGHCNLPTKNGSLGQWISYQRALFRSKKLKADRYEKLVGIGFAFEDTSLASENVKWNRRFLELEKYKEKNGHCNLPTTNRSLGKWISTQRTLFRSKKLKADRYEKLVGIGFRLEEKWESRFRDLAAYKEQHGNCLVPRNDNGLLGSWVLTQRTLFRFKNLKEDRYEKLVGIGFVFEDARVAMDNEKWNRLFIELVKYKEKNGHCNVPRRNGSIGKWIKNQRRLFKSKKLKADRDEKLVGIGFA